MSEQGRCKDCKWWGRFREKSGFAGCERISHDSAYVSYGDWLNEPKDPDNVLDEFAVVIDGSGYSAGLMTQADFGCVLFEAKKEGGE